MRSFLITLLFLFLTACAVGPDSEKSPAKIQIPKLTETKAKLPKQVPGPVKTPVVKPNLSAALKKWCSLTDAAFKRYSWGNSRCDEFNWQHVRNSSKGNAIPWVIFGEEKDLAEKNVTLIMCGVHGDEITPVKFCYDIIHDLSDFRRDFTKRVVVVAPLVSPDSFFKDKPTRTNGRGVDVNRNFPTKDWNGKALSLWKGKYRKDKRRFPGHKALSEQETVFQINLINRYQPSKIISVHSPLTLLDYDGPATKKRTSPTAAKDLLLSMSEKASGYKISNYPYFPGSLGNWAGHELGIPTYTLELPNSNPQQNDKFWKLFREAIHHAIEQTVVPIPEPEASAAISPKPTAQ